MVWSPLSAIESFGFEHTSQEMCWEREHCELINRSNRYNNNEKLKDHQYERYQRMELENRKSKRELRRLRKENEKLIQENETLKKQIKERDIEELSLLPKAICEASDSSIRHAGFMLPKFNGTDPINFAETWLNNISRNSSLFSWTEKQTFLAAKLALEGDAKNWLMAQRRDITNWKDFQLAFNKRYCRKNNSIAKIHLSMVKRKKKPDESIMDYISDMKKLGRRINLNENDLMEYIILGISDIQLVKVISEQFSSLEDLEDFLEERDIRVAMAKREFEKRKCYNCKAAHLLRDCKEDCEGMDLLEFCICIAMLYIFQILLTL